MLSLHYIQHVSCPVLVLRMVLQKIYYQYLYGAIDVDGPWWHGHK